METMPFSPPNILVVDDVNANLVVLTEMISNAGYIARPVTSAKQALSAIEALSPNLILMDISMPEVDGFEFCSMLKKSVSTRDIPVIFISALNSAEDKIKGFRSGAVDYIAKPFEVEEVTLRIDTHIKMYKMQQELEAYNKRLYKIINDQIRRIYEEQKNVINALALLEKKCDNSKTDHLEHIGKNSKILAMSLQLSPKFKNQITNSFIDAIEVAAQLHDIGMLYTSDSQSFGQDIFTENEHDINKMHTIDGANILEEIYSFNQQNEFLRMAIDIAKYHHENWNGSGYPMAIKGTEIPLSARIVAIADVYDSLISDKNIEQVYNHERTIEFINNGANVLFDPDIVAIFNKIHHQLKK